MARDTVQEWKDEHLQAGMEQGSTNEARAILRRQLARRFGGVPSEVNDRLEAASRGELENWIDRLYDAATLDEVFQ